MIEEIALQHGFFLMGFAAGIAVSVAAAWITWRILEHG